ncbi:MAG: hypothetical protein KF696_10210 [Planctomycetes bacterium]|nr:hypothetical protein [Planctomycetota bacterium]MCW8135198.1 hypothetical protein [Planctomycetota bacterium]
MPHAPANRVAQLPGLLAALVCLAPCLCGQGFIGGSLKDMAGGETYLPEPAKVLAITLPDDSHPFNEICAAQWQQAMDALADGREPDTPFGGLQSAVAAQRAAVTEAGADGSFRLEGLPFERRLALAAKVDGLWWPLEREQWLTEQQPGAEVRIPFAFIDNNAAPWLREHILELSLVLREDLKYAGITILETLRFENPDPSRAALVKLSLDLSMPPDILARHLPTLYGSQLLFMQAGGTPGDTQPEGTPLARQAWKFGGGDFMHGGGAVYNKGPQFSADNWHPLNVDALKMTGAGDTRFVEKPSASARAAALEFTRVVPPARDGKPGTLVLRVSHRAGVPIANPGGKVALNRSFPLELQGAAARLAPGLTLQALVTDGHRKLYGDKYVSTAPLAAGQAVQFIIGLDDDAQAQVAAFDIRTTEKPSQPKDGSTFRWDMMFKVLAVIFGLAFIGALVASLRWPREKQLQRLADLPASRAEVLAELKALQEDYEARRLPAAAYLEQKQRLLNRLIEFDTRAE